MKLKLSSDTLWTAAAVITCVLVCGGWLAFLILLRINPG